MIPTASAKDDPALRWFGRGVLAAISFPAWMVTLGLVGIGSLARDVGHGRA